jgi:RNA polymerase sigma factor (sigma-70 family)
MTDGPLDAAALLRRADAGDEQSIEQLLVRNLDLLHAFVRLRIDESTRRHESLSDIVSSVCREVLGQRQRFEFRSEPEFRSWLFGAVVNKLRDRRDHYRAGKRNPIREQDQRVEDLAAVYRTTLDPLGHAMRAEDCARFEFAFDALTPIQREVLTLRYLVGLDYAAIAAQLGASNDSVRAAAARGRARLSVQVRDRRRD